MLVTGKPIDLSKVKGYNVSIDYPDNSLFMNEKLYYIQYCKERNLARKLNFIYGIKFINKEPILVTYRSLTERLVCAINEDHFYSFDFHEINRLDLFAN